MHKKDIFEVIYDKHLYEYLIINRNFRIIDYSERIINYCDTDSIDDEDSDIFTLIPELFGMRNDLIDIFDEREDHILLPTISKAPDYYIDITIKRGSNNTLIILLEDVTETIKSKRQLQQDHNEKIILSKELTKKNAQLEVYNMEMNRLVQEEIAKNIENQNLIRLQARHAQMGELIGMITHQWKQPLSIINLNGGYLKIKYSEDIKDKNIFDSKINNILMQSKHLNQTIVDFQNFFNPHATRETFSPREAIDKVLTLVHQDYISKSIHITIDEKCDPCIMGYANEYGQVILSILQNARDAFLSQPNKNMRINISIDKKDQRSIVKIRDNAGGIPSEIIDRVFDVYLSTKKNGSGLGLHISKSIIEQKMGGTISVENVDNGAEFTITVM